MPLVFATLKDARLWPRDWIPLDVHEECSQLTCSDRVSRTFWIHTLPWVGRAQNDGYSIRSDMFQVSTFFVPTLLGLFIAGLHNFTYSFMYMFISTKFRRERARTTEHDSACSAPCGGSGPSSPACRLHWFIFWLFVVAPAAPTAAPDPSPFLRGKPQGQDPMPDAIGCHTGVHKHASRRVLSCAQPTGMLSRICHGVICRCSRLR